MADYIRKAFAVQVWHRGDPIPDDWPSWVFHPLKDRPEPIWKVRMGAGGPYADYYDEESFNRDFEAV